MSRRSAWGAASRGGAHERRHERERAGARAAGRRSARQKEARRGGGGVTGQTHLAGGALFTAAGLGAAIAAGWMHAPAWALAIGIAWGAIAGDLPDIDHPKARVSRSEVGVRSRRPVARPSHPNRRRVHPGPARNAPRPHTLARVHGAVGGDCRPFVSRVRRRPAGRTRLDGRQHRRGFAHERARERSGDALPVRGPCRSFTRTPCCAPRLDMARTSCSTRSRVPSRGGGRSLVGASRSRPRPSGSAPGPHSRPGWSGRRLPWRLPSRFSRSPGCHSRAKPSR